MAGPLKGLLVLDFSTLLPGPLASLMLLEAGAEVIKIERPGTGEDMRAAEPFWQGESLGFAVLNRGKRSLALDLKSPQAMEILRPLIKRADIIVEQFRPGVMARLGLDYKAVQAINPAIIYCSITGYGQAGPKCQTAGHDLNYVGDTGLLSLSAGSHDQPTVPPGLIADIGGGTLPAVINILLALRARDQSGKGAHLDIAMSEGVFTFAYWAFAKGAALGEPLRNGGERLTGGSPRYHLYRSRDDRLIAVAALEQKFWDAFCSVIDLEPALRADSNPAVINILLALRARDQSGKGAHLDIAMSEGVFTFAYWAFAKGAALGEPLRNGGERLTGGSPRYHLYRSRDDRLIAVAALEQKFWDAFCSVIDLEPALRADSENPDQTIAAVAKILATRTAAEWEPLLTTANCCCSLVRNMDDVLDDPHFKERGIYNWLVEGADGGSAPAMPLPIAPAFRASPKKPLRAPKLGEHNDDI